MAKKSTLKYELVIPENIWTTLHDHLFPGDNDEHGAIIAASIAKSGNRIRLLARHLFTAVDGIDYVPSPRGYRMLTAEFVRDKALFCRDEKLAYLAIHNHGGIDSVEFSDHDFQSHERGYPALKDITRGQVVGALVFAKKAIAGDLWLSDQRVPLEKARILGKNIFDIYPSPAKIYNQNFEIYDRQARIFGERGQSILKNQKVGIIGLGGVGSIVCEYLARLGVGSLVLIDPDKIESTNIPRIVGSIRSKNSWLSKLVNRFLGHPICDIGKFKVDIAEREVLRANPEIKIIKYMKSVVDTDVALSLTSCDYIFLAADSMQARLIFNAIVHQFLIPGFQLGAKVPVDRASGDIGRAFSVIRPVLPGHGCLWCNGLVTPDGLQSEALTDTERREQKYIEGEDIPSPSVITLNAVSAAYAVNDYLFRVTGLRDKSACDDYIYIEPKSNSVRYEMPRIDKDCSECGTQANGRFGKGDSRDLPTTRILGK